MLKIELITIENGAAVQFPFEIKDLFRKHVPSAKWNSAEKRWEVGPRSVARLQSWIDMTNKSGVLDVLAARETAVIEGKAAEKLAADFAELKAELELTNREIAAAKAAKEQSEEVLSKIAEKRAELDTAKAELATEKTAADGAKSSVENAISDIADVAEIAKLRGEMLRNLSKRADNSMRFDRAQERLKEIRKALRNAGFDALALRLACNNASVYKPQESREQLQLAIEFEALEG